MGLFDFWKNKSEQQSPATTYFKFLSGYSPVFSSHDGGVYEMLQTRRAIDCIATHFSKLRLEPEGEGSIQTNRLLLKPNRLQTPSQFLYRTATVLVADSTAFIIPLTVDGEHIHELITSVPQSVNAVEAADGTRYYEFTFYGQKYLIEADKVGVLTQFQYKHDLYGTGNSPIKPTMEIIHKQNEGLIERIVNSAQLQWMGKINSQTSPQDIKDKRDEFAKMNLSTENASGLMLYDNSFADLKQVEYKNYTVEPEEQELIDGNVYKYFGVNENIMENSFDEEGWNAFFEGCIEPLAIQASEVLSGLLGERILLTANRMQYASNQTKVEVTQTLIDRGIITLDEALVNIWNMKPLPNGEGAIRIIRGEYINVDKLPEHTLTKAQGYLGVDNASEN